MSKQPKLVQIASSDPYGLPAGAPHSQRVNVAIGRNPLGLARHPDPDGKICGTCDYAMINERARKYYKCRIMRTSGKATDIRLRWPACASWKEHT